MQQLIKACNEYQCFRILLFTHLEKTLSEVENFSIPEIFLEAGFSAKHQFAFVELNPDINNSQNFIETLLNHRGLNVRVFYDGKDALNWLLKDNKKDNVYPIKR